MPRRKVFARWRAREAIAGTIAHGTWIIIAVALATSVAALIAIPGSPVHHWLRQLTDSITSISS